MSSKAANRERRLQNEATYDRETAERESRKAAFSDKFGALEARLEELGIDPGLLAQYLVPEREERAAYAAQD